MSRLNINVLQKMVRKSGKSAQYLREQISRRASRHSVSSTAAQLAWAKQMGIGIATALAKVSPDVRDEVRGLGTAPANLPPPARRVSSLSRRRRQNSISAEMINALLQDQQLRTRCKDLLRANQHFDRVIREATTVLDDRLKRRTGITNMNPDNLIGKAINSDPNKAVIEVSSVGAEQAGFHSICKGIMLAFRNNAHHSLSDKFTREDALKFCGFLDTVLGMIEKGIIHRDRV